jgi:hypothetical protein
MTDFTTSPLPHPRQLPSGDDIRQAKSMIDQLDQNIEDLEQSIRQLQRRIEELQEQRANYVSYISPLRRLPTEILSEIIRKCLQNGVDITVMSSICNRLREVALGMSGLWRRIRILKAESKRDPTSKPRLYECYGSSTSVSDYSGLNETVLSYC